MKRISGISGYLHLKIFNLITSAKSLLPCKVPCSQTLGIRTQTCLGRTLFSLPCNHGQITEQLSPIEHCRTVRHFTCIPSLNSIFFFFLNYTILGVLYLFIYGCGGSSFLCEGSLQLRQAGATLHHGVRASHYRRLSCCGTQAPDAQAQQLWLTGPLAPRHVGSSQTRARTRVPYIGRQTLNHCATREALIP